ncbi:thiosulfate oxidation carrier complex protein SoxZ [Marinobacter alexandrii]|uniref:thiosulfate oxidation carrier complex protein SoxZ n=1 Tax=Marinobacter alexandrii TaxID=2570351 RepID=UPI0032987A2D
MTIRISAPSSANRGDVIELKAMIQHDMESGYRRDQYGRPITRDILKYFECHYSGEMVFRAELFPGIAANPFLSFYTTATESGTLLFRWIDQNGQTWEEQVLLEVS